MVYLFVLRRELRTAVLIVAGLRCQAGKLDSDAAVRAYGWTSAIAAPFKHAEPAVRYAVAPDSSDALQRATTGSEALSHDADAESLTTAQLAAFHAVFEQSVALSLTMLAKHDIVPVLMDLLMYAM